jgi:1-acyl-sn-glycerol-3-phosphate acyltransferase
MGHRLRARGAAPLLVSGSHLVAAAAATGSDRALTASERWVAWLAGRLAGIDFDVNGLEHIDPTRSYVVAPLHEGFADILALLRLPLALRFAARDELFGWPALGRYLTAAGHLEVVERAGRAETRDFLASARSVIQSGRSLVLFPQGSVLGLEVAFRPGPLRIARRFGVPILPVVLTGSHMVWEHPYTSVVRFGQRISMRVLEPVPAAALDEASYRDLERVMKARALADDMAPVRRYRPEVDGWWDGYSFEIDPDFQILKARVDARREATPL